MDNFEVLELVTRVGHKLKELINSRFDQLQEHIRMDQATLAASLTALANQIAGFQTQVTTDINELESALKAAGGTTPAVDAALAQLQSTVTALGAAIPDPTTLPGAPAPTPAPPAPAPAPEPPPAPAPSVS